MKRGDTDGERGDVRLMQGFAGLRVEWMLMVRWRSWEGLGIHLCRECVFTSGLQMR